MITLRIRINHSFMFTFNMFLQISCCSGNIFTLVLHVYLRIYNDHRNISLFQFYIRCLFRSLIVCSSVSTLVTGIAFTFMYLFNMSLQNYIYLSGVYKIKDPRGGEGKEKRKGKGKEKGKEKKKGREKGKGKREREKGKEKKK